MDINEKPVKSCAIKVHLANLINRKSHVTLVVPELCNGLTIKTTAMRKIGMNEQHVKATELFISVRDNFRMLMTHDVSDGSNLFHVLDSNSPGHFVNLRFCEFHLYWKESLPSTLEKSVNISEFRSRASKEEKLVSAVNTKLSTSYGQPNGPPKATNFILKSGVSAPANHNFQMNLQSQARNSLIEKSERRHLNKGNSNSISSAKKLPEKTESSLSNDANPIGSCSLTSEIKRRPSLLSVKAKMKELGAQSKMDVPKEEVKIIPGKHETANSPCSSYSSSSIEVKHHLSSSMPVLNKVTPKDLLNIQNRKNFFTGKRANSKTNISDYQCNLTASERISTSRRQLPQVAASEEDVEEKRYLLSKQLEKRLIRRATFNESSESNKKPINKTHSLLGWKERFKSGNEDSDDSRSLASQEVAEIMADAGPMGIVESDYEDPESSGKDDEEERSDPSGKNGFLSLFDSMASDPIDESSDVERKVFTESSQFDTSLSGRSGSEWSNKSYPSKHESLKKNLPLKTEFQSIKSSFTSYSNVKQNRHCKPQNKLTLFELLKPGVLKLFPVSVNLLEKSSNAIRREKILPFKVYNDVIRLTASTNDFSNKINEMTKTFNALKIRNLEDVSPSNQKSKNKDLTGFKPGDLLIEVNNFNVLGFTESQFSDLEASVLSKCDAIHMVIARPSRNL